MRSILVDWLVEVAQEYKLHSDTLYQTVGMIDRYLSVARVPRNYLQLVGVSCMLVASKYEEIYCQTVSRMSGPFVGAHSLRRDFDAAFLSPGADSGLPSFQNSASRLIRQIWTVLPWHIMDSLK